MGAPIAELDVVNLELLLLIEPVPLLVLVVDPLEDREEVLTLLVVLLVGVPPRLPDAVVGKEKERLFSIKSHSINKGYIHFLVCPGVPGLGGSSPITNIGNFSNISLSPFEYFKRKNNMNRKIYLLRYD